MSILLESITYFRKRLKLAVSVPLVVDQFRQLDLLQVFIDIVTWYKRCTPENRPIIEEALWALINYCCSNEQAVLELEPLGFFHLVLRVIEETDEPVIYENVDSYSNKGCNVLRQHIRHQSVSERQTDQDRSYRIDFESVHYKEPHDYLRL